MSARTTLPRIAVLILTGLGLALGASAGSAGAATRPAIPEAQQCPPAWLGFTLAAHPALSGDGRFVAFDLRSPDGDSGGTSAVMLRDTQRAITYSLAQKTATSTPYGPVISDDGSTVAYLLAVTSGAGGRQNDLYVYDRRNATTTYQGHADANSELALSADGRFLTFRSAGTGESDWSIPSQIYVRDLDRHRTSLVSISTSGTKANGNSITPTISADGRQILFSSSATDLVAGVAATNGLYVRNLATRTTSVLRVSGDGSILSAGTGAQLSPDGRYVVFINQQVFRYDRVTGRSLAIGPAPTEERTLGGYLISGNGRYVAYATTFLVGGDAGDAFTQLIVHDVVTRRHEQANPGLGGDQPWTGAYYGALSPNGRYLTFYSEASNLVPNDTNGEFDVFVRDLKTNRTVLVSAPSAGPPGCTADPVTQEARSLTKPHPMPWHYTRSVN